MIKSIFILCSMHIKNVYLFSLDTHFLLIPRVINPGVKLTEEQKLSASSDVIFDS